MDRLGEALVVVAFIAVVIAYPPPATGIEPLFGMGDLFLPLLVSIGALLFGVLGGISLGRNATGARSGGVQSLAIRVSIAVGTVSAIGVYLIVVAGFAPGAPFIAGAITLAIAGSIVSEFIR